MKIIESFVLGKQGRADRCEDGWVVTDAYAAVVDGSTSKLPPAEAAQRPKSGGRQAMEITLEAIRRLPPQATKDEALSLLTAALRREMPPGALERAERRLTCSAVVYSAARREVWMVGDCQCRFGGRTYTHTKAVDAVLTRIRCDVIAYLLAHGHTEDELRRRDLGRAAILDALREQTNFQNDTNAFNPYRYPVLDGTPVDPAAVPVLPLGAARRLVLASDGYPDLLDTLAATEDRLAALLRDDPLCYRLNPATKGLAEGNLSFDDRTYLSIEP